MSRNVTIMSCKGYKYVRVCESYRNAEGKPRSKVIENRRKSNRKVVLRIRTGGGVRGGGR